MVVFSAKTVRAVSEFIVRCVSVIYCYWSDCSLCCQVHAIFTRNRVHMNHVYNNFNIVYMITVSECSRQCCLFLSFFVFGEIKLIIDMIPEHYVHVTLMLQT